MVTDSGTLGEKEENSHLTIPAWTFGLVIEDSVFSTGFDAIIGMAYPQFAAPGVTPFFEALRQTGKLAREEHSWYLSLNPDEQSEIVMGGRNEERFNKTQLNWHPVINKLFWTLKLDDVKIGGVSTGFCTRAGANCTVAPDSGTSLLTMPPAHYKEF